ncbi:MAG: DUF6488 family protein [Mariprofundaceae bacterium]|nr:DUF6488 family protein [Mariprofundaceae bacterium]
MLKKMLFILVLCSPMLLTQAFAHGGGHAPAMTSEEVVSLASKYVVSLVKKKSEIDGKALDASWVNIPEKDKKIERELSWYYVVSFKHEEEKKKLYLMISKKGKLYRADYEGVFKEFE